MGYAVRYMGRFNCKENLEKYTFEIPEFFLKNKMDFPIYKDVQLLVKSSDTLNAAPFSYIIFSMINLLVIVFVMVCIFCKRKEFFVTAKKK